MPGKTVVVTGAAGFIASYLVKGLLERGYQVRGTVRNPGFIEPHFYTQQDDVENVQHLLELPGAKERLTLYKADLLEEGSFDSVVNGVGGVFHTASPVHVQNVTNPQVQQVDPAVNGTLNVLQAVAKSKSVKRVVLTSSTSAALFNRRPLTTDTVVDESWWSDPEYCKENQGWYNLSKTLAEKAAWDFVKDLQFDLVAINPGMVFGAPLQSKLDNSSSIVLGFLSGGIERYRNAVYGVVDVTDVSRAHVLAYENPEAEGRYFLIERVLHFRDLAELLRDLYPGYPVQSKPAYDLSQELQVFKNNPEKTKKLGLNYRPIMDSIEDVVVTLKQRQFLGEA